MQSHPSHGLTRVKLIIQFVSQILPSSAENACSLRRVGLSHCPHEANDNEHAVDVFPGIELAAPPIGELPYRS